MMVIKSLLWLAGVFLLIVIGFSIYVRIDKAARIEWAENVNVELHKMNQDYQHVIVRCDTGGTIRVMGKYYGESIKMIELFIEERNVSHYRILYDVLIIPPEFKTLMNN